MEKNIMGKYRNVNTDFWGDSYIETLNNKEKLLYLYVLTSPHGNLAGAYQVSIKYVSIDTDITVSEVSKIFEKFQNDGKIIYKDNWIGIKNFIKHQQTNNKQINDAINKQLKTVPDFIISFINDPLMSHTSAINGSNDNDSDNVNDSINVLSTVFMEKFNKYMPVKIHGMTDKRNKSLKERLKDTFFKDNWEKALQLVPNIAFLNGENERKWKADFDFFMRNDTVMKIVEGKYNGGLKGRIGEVGQPYIHLNRFKTVEVKEIK